MSKNESVERLRSFLESRGSVALKKARESILNESFACKKVRDALRYFMVEYWHNYTTPTLLFLSHEAVGGKPERLVNLASALILIDGAIDIHDDVVDRSRRKDGRWTVYGKFGKEVTLLVGDALFMKGFMKLVKACQTFEVEKTRKILDFLKKGFFELGEAEVLELEFRRRFDVKPERYLEVMYKKAANVEALMYVGAFLGSAKAKEMEILGRYGRIVGLISILRDDLIDMTLQEELIHRIDYECLPLPLIYALNNSEIKSDLIKLLHKKKKTKEDLEKIFDFAQKGQGIAKTKRYIRKKAMEGEKLVNSLKGKNELNLILRGLTDFENI